MPQDGLFVKNLAALREKNTFLLHASQRFVPWAARTANNMMSFSVSFPSPTGEQDLSNTQLGSDMSTTVIALL